MRWGFQLRGLEYIATNHDVRGSNPSSPTICQKGKDPSLWRWFDRPLAKAHKKRKLVFIRDKSNNVHPRNAVEEYPRTTHVFFAEVYISLETMATVHGWVLTRIAVCCSNLFHKISRRPTLPLTQHVHKTTKFDLELLGTWNCFFKAFKIIIWHVWFYARFFLSLIFL